MHWAKAVSYTHLDVYKRQAEKATQAVAAGAIATIIYNNEPGSIHMDLSNYKRTEPVVSITQEERALLQANATPVTDEAGNVLYYQGTLFVEEGVDSTIYDLSLIHICW